MQPELLSRKRMYWHMPFLLQMMLESTQLAYARFSIVYRTNDLSEENNNAVCGIIE
jgi:hypothetical protein